MNPRILICFLVYLAAGSFAAPQTETDAHEHVSLQEFSQLMTTLSEPEGYFDSDNFVSNEAGYLRVLPALKQLGVHGGVYLGVGPDQNYSYIAGTMPELAILVDVRRQNALQHLYYKALFQLSQNRYEYLARLFGKRMPPKPLGTGGASISELLTMIDQAPVDQALSRKKLTESCQVIVGWNIGITSADLEVIRYIAESFVEGGLDMKFTSYMRAPRPHHPTYGVLLQETDSHGVPSSFMAQEASFQYVKRMHCENRIIPVVGDLGGSYAIHRTAEELRRRHLQVECCYVSNVEFYLFGGDRWSAYLRNMNSLPWAANGTLIRSYANMWRPHPAQIPGYYMTSLLQSAHSFIENVTSGKIRTYWDLVTTDNVAR